MIKTNWKVCWSTCTIVHRGRSVVAKPVTPYVYLGLLQIWKLERRQQVACSQDGAWVCSWLCCTVETTVRAFWVHGSARWSSVWAAAWWKRSCAGSQFDQDPAWVTPFGRQVSWLWLGLPSPDKFLSGVQKKWSEDMLRCSVAPSQEWDVIMIGNKKWPLYPTWVVEASMAQKGWSSRCDHPNTPQGTTAKNLSSLGSHLVLRKPEPES